ncbi:hypothetical protein NMY22_g18079 [Coprinellus aureogranulatus]|nr:hypothetical protein NMY22_g18079 [Coprinellus aureogranulatus]
MRQTRPAQLTDSETSPSHLTDFIGLANGKGTLEINFRHACDLGDGSRDILFTNESRLRLHIRRAGGISSVFGKVKMWVTENAARTREIPERAFWLNLKSLWASSSSLMSSEPLGPRLNEKRARLHGKRDMRTLGMKEDLVQLRTNSLALFMFTLGNTHTESPCGGKPSEAGSLLECLMALWIQQGNFEKKVSGLTAVKELVKNEGVTAFFKGLTPKILVAGPKLVFSYTLPQLLIPLFSHYV